MLLREPESSLLTALGIDLASELPQSE
jgi:hypothetical protein